jgi:hypothetical protein
LIDGLDLNARFNWMAAAREKLRTPPRRRDRSVAPTRIETPPRPRLPLSRIAPANRRLL